MTSAIDDSAVLRAMKSLSCEQFNLLLREHESNKLICFYSSGFRGQLVRALQLVKGSSSVEDT